MYGIGKNTALKVLIGGHHLTRLGQQTADANDIISEATDFIAACYGSKVSEGDMSTHRYAMWKAKMANPKITAAPKLKTLPPSNEAFVAHVKRAHYQTMIWMSATQSDPPVLDPTDYGWTKAEDGMPLSPTTLTDWCIARAHQHPSNDQMWMFYNPTMFYWKMWLRSSPNVLFDVL